ncbi:MAG: oligosaccharide flippase family protein, partial [Actinobacteria bacterium]|nr:oligosaccharide flippase family protein [Actinomycetota bacterium]
MEHTEAAQVCALAGALGSVLVLVPRRRALLLLGLALLGAATLGIVRSLAGDEDLATLFNDPAGMVLVAVGIAAMTLGAIPLVRYPAAVPVALLVAAPFRIPVQVGAEEAFLLLPLYLVLASSAPEHRRLVLRTSFWFTMAMATAGLAAGLILSGTIAELLFGSPDDSELVMASFVGLWAGMNYEQLTSLFRVEERSGAFVTASLANILLTIGATLLLVVALDQGPIGVIVGNFTGTLLVYAALIGYRREQLGLQFDRSLLREMNRFGVPLIPTALFLWVTNFSDRLFLVRLADTTEVGLYSVGVRIASAMVLLLTAFRLAWPAFAYSIEDEREARRTYAYVLTYLVLLTTWVATGLALLSPWIVEWIAAPAFAESSRVVGPLAFAAVAFGAYIVVVIGVGRARRTQFNWVVT